MSTHMCNTAQTWADNTPKSTGNAFSIPKRVTPEPKKKKTRRKPERAVTTAWMTEPMPGLSKRAQKELMVPTARVPVIPQAQRSNT